MKQVLYILTFVFLIVLISCKTLSDEPDWSTINEFKYYGFTNPTENKKFEKFILADIVKIKKLFVHLKKSNGYIPKGASRYAKISFDNNNVIIIQIIAGGQLPFRIINKDIFKDNWFELDEIYGQEWKNYIDNLTIKLED
jgi:hypothetical protein